MTSLGLRSGARPVAAACVCAVRTRLSSRASTRATSTARRIPRTRAWPVCDPHESLRLCHGASPPRVAHPAWDTLTREDVEDAVQDVLLWAWERRHCAHMTDFPGSISAVIRATLRKRSWRRPHRPRTACRGLGRSPSREGAEPPCKRCLSQPPARRRSGLVLREVTLQGAGCTLGGSAWRGVRHPQQRGAAARHEPPLEAVRCSAWLEVVPRLCVVPIALITAGWKP